MLTEIVLMISDKMETEKCVAYKNICSDIAEENGLFLTVKNGVSNWLERNINIHPTVLLVYHNKRIYRFFEGYQDKKNIEKFIKRKIYSEVSKCPGKQQKF